MDTDIDYSTWYTKQQAAEIIGVSTKTVEQFAKDGQIQQARWKRPTGGPKVSVYAPEDVDRVVGKRANGTAYVMPQSAYPPANGDMTSTAVVKHAHRGGNVDGAALLQAVLQAVQRGSETEKLFLTIPEASRFTGLTEGLLRRQCQAGTLAAIKDGGWKIRRTALLVSHFENIPSQRSEKTAAPLSNAVVAEQIKEIFDEMRSQTSENVPESPVNASGE